MIRISELMDAVRKGDHASFVLIVNRFDPMLQGISNQSLSSAEDTYQELVLHLWLKICGNKKRC